MKTFVKIKYALLIVAASTLAACNNGENNVVPDSEKKIDHLIFEEICYTGSWHETWKQLYDHDQYIKITNPTEQVFYLDGMALAQSGLSSNKLMNLKSGTDHRETHFGAAMLIRFPGKAGEQNYPVEPGKSVFIAKIAHDHSKFLNEETYWCDNSYDLSKVNFEWASENQIATEDMYPDNKDVPNMKTVYPVEYDDDSTLPLQIIPTSGAIALVQIPENITDKMLIEEKEYSWSTIWTTNEKENEGGVGQQGGGHSHNNEYDPVVFIKLPNAWIIDAVQICPQKEFQWNVISTELDGGYCSVLTYANDKFKNAQSLAGKALRRKHDGKKFVDTNNSSVDFEVKEASLAKNNKDNNKK